MKEALINFLNNDNKNENFVLSSSKIPQTKSNIKNKKKTTIYLNDVLIIFDFKIKKTKEIIFEVNNYEDEKNKKIKNLIQMLKVKINQDVFKNDTSKIGCSIYSSYIYDNSLNFFF
jgi:uncharacterized membrane protein